MLAPYTRSQFVEKMVTDCTGRQFRALFFVALVDGQIRARLVSLQPVAKQILALPGAVSDSIVCLAATTSEKEVETPYFAYIAPVVSPYFDLELILSSQPTRAPSHK